MGNFQDDLLKSIKTEKGDIADAIGMPDARDYETLSRIIRRFERTHPGLIAFHMRSGRQDYELGLNRHKKTRDGRAVVSKESDLTYVFELPAQLHTAIEKVFPTMFRSKKHLGWFKKNYIKLTIGGG